MNSSRCPLIECAAAGKKKKKKVKKRKRKRKRWIQTQPYYSFKVYVCPESRHVKES